MITFGQAVRCLMIKRLGIFVRRGGEMSRQMLSAVGECAGVRGRESMW